jgi:hypothetical protein
MENLNNKLYTDLPIDELEKRLSAEELEEKLELGTVCVGWYICDCPPDCTGMHVG